MRPSLIHLLSIALLLGFWACAAEGEALFSDIDPDERGGDGGGGANMVQTQTDKVDLLLVIDNSRSMADKQEILGLALPELIASLTNPTCIDAQGRPVSGQPASHGDLCPSGSSRRFPPVADIHVGVITTSLGGHGADSCSAADESQNDRAHLITRGPDGEVDTYEDGGFLVWDPDGKRTPKGEGNADVLQARLRELVLGAGQVGCGFEASLESWYRFLIEPDPHQSVLVENNTAELIGTDDTVLQQREDFLRPDSLVLILLLTDENDCSIRDGGQAFFAAQLYQSGTTIPFHLPPPRAACADDPDDPCCRSCGEDPGPGCSEAADDCDTPLTSLEDHVNLRCFDQKRRFGLDFLWPLDRYTEGLGLEMITDRQGDVVANPLFADGLRDRRLVYLATLTGVPWQDIARTDASGDPDLLDGLDAEGRPVGGYQTAAELAANDTWVSLLSDPLMREAVDPRAGSNPVTGEAVAPVTAGYDANVINGHERTIGARDDLQYACIFPLLEPRDCSDLSQNACECPSATTDNPLCQQPDGTYTTIQLRAKAYPGRRQLAVVRQIETQGVVGSVCAPQIDDTSRADYGYRPFVQTLVESVEPRLQP